MSEPKPHIIALARDAVRGVFRATVPIRALIAQGRATGNVSIGIEQAPTLVPGSPLLLLGMPVLPPTVLASAKRNNCRLVCDVDEPFWPTSAEIVGRPPATASQLAQTEKYLRCADLITVSTEPLAEALRQRGYESVVVPDTVDQRDWTTQPLRSQRRLPRIGWHVPLSLHATELALIEAIVLELVDEAEFAFFGHASTALAPLSGRVEQHLTVPLSFFPSMFAAIDVDILLAPLAQNAFNEFRSNILLLQAGMLGCMVLATDIEPYRRLPVTSLPNTPLAWIKAIRERIDEPAAMRMEGERLRRAVHAEFLTESWSERCLTHWTSTTSAAIHA